MSLSLDLIGKQILIYGGIIVLITGLIGELFNTIIFISLRTFRQSSCVFYLIIMSFLNIGQLCTVVLSRIMIGIYGSDGTDLSVFYCKFRFFFSQFCTVFSLTCFCLATIDQYCATCRYQCLRQLCTIKIVQRVTLTFFFIWILHGIPYFLFYDHVITPTTNKITCSITNSIYLQYRTYAVLLIFLVLLPICITVLFGILAYRNVRQLAYYTVPIVRRQFDKQITAMVLVQVAVNFFLLFPYGITSVLSLNKDINSNPIVQTYLQFSSNITIILYYMHLSNPFYIYICVSKRFRQQFLYVVLRMNWNQMVHIPVNHVVPIT